MSCEKQFSVLLARLIVAYDSLSPRRVCVCVLSVQFTGNLLPLDY